MAGIKRRIYICVALILFFAGLVLISYPHIKGEQLETEAAESIVQFVEAKKNERENTSFSILYPELYQAMKDYNQHIFAKKQDGLKDSLAYAEPSFKLSDYGIETETIAVLNIPALELSMPVYLGANEQNMAAGAAHMSNTSLPVGGESTHCVLSGHRGLPSARLFTDLDKIVVGDYFILRVLDEILTYEVDQILIVEPDETTNLLIEEGKDLCTLVTCTPYGINSHRLLVRGHRIENKEESKVIRITSDAIQIEPLLVAPILAMPILLILLIVLLLPKKPTYHPGGDDRDES